jgi:hypothetical protein
MSIFDLKTSVEELSSTNQGTSRMEYEQHPPTRDVTLDNFPNGAIHFRFQTAGQKWWCPSRSYLRMRCQISKQNGTQLTSEDNIAPNMGLCASLFQSAEFRINDKTVSRISDFMPQIDALETRLSKSKSWLDGIGKSVNIWGENFEERQGIICSDIKEDSKGLTSQKNRTELGFDAATNTIAVAVDTGVMTLAAAGGGALPDATQIFDPGDVIELEVGGETYIYTVSAALTATTVQLDKVKTIAVPAGAHGLVRKRKIETDSARGVKQFELIWQPPLSIFKIGHALPGMKAELVLNPQTQSSYQQTAIQSVIANKVAGTDFKFEVKDMYFYCNTVEGPRADDVSYLLDLEQTTCQSDNVPGVSFAQRNFDVSPSTYALTVAYQDSRVNSDTQFSQSKFKSYGAISSDSEEELKLNRFFINYAGQNLPSPDADPEYKVADAVDYTVQRFAETSIYSGAMFDSGGGESLSDWHDRGAYYYFSWPRDGTDRSTRVNVHQGFETGTVVANMRVLLFSHNKQVARVQVSDGRVVDVQLEDA